MAREEQRGITKKKQRNLLNLLSLDWCREGELNPHDRKGRRILSPILGRLQQAASQRTDSHNLHRIRDLRAIPILQDVAVNGSNVGGEHAPEHALNLDSKYSLENRAPGRCSCC
jgi:hypothetical protein